MINWAALLLRFGLGTIFVLHGAQKALGWFSGPGVKGFSQFLGTLGFTHPLAWAYLAAYTEFICGICVFLGIAVRINSFFLLVLISVAGFKVHLSKGFFLQQGGFEYIFLIAIVCCSLMLMGAGKYSLWNKY